MLVGDAVPGMFEIPSSARHHADGVGGAITQDISLDEKPNLDTSEPE